jgi:hypothetical protein
MTLKTSLVLAAVVVLPVLAARAQTAPDTASIWTLQEENSAYPRAAPRDHFYTNGIRLGWTSPPGAVPETISGIGAALWGNGEQRIGIDLSQQIYTPLGTQATDPNPSDRPYAGLLLGNLSLLSDTRDTRGILMLSLGILGPSAGGEDVQNGFHDLFNIPDVRGWKHQIQNTPAAELLHDRTWRLTLASFGGLETDALPSLAAGIGDVRDYVQAGVTVRAGQGLDSDFGVPRPRPGLSGGDAYAPTRTLAWYVFAGADGQAVGYDLLLQSSPFRSGPHVQPTWDVGEVQAGAAVMARGLRLTVAYVAQTPEFHHQRGGLHQLASVSLSFRF